MAALTSSEEAVLVAEAHQMATRIDNVLEADVLLDVRCKCLDNFDVSDRSSEHNSNCWLKLKSSAVSNATQRACRTSRSPKIFIVTLILQPRH